MKNLFNNDFKYMELEHHEMIDRGFRRLKLDVRVEEDEQWRLSTADLKKRFTRLYRQQLPLSHAWLHIRNSSVTGQAWATVNILHERY